MKNFVAIYFPEQWSITNGGVPVCHLEGEYNNQVFAEFVAKALNAAQQSAQDGAVPQPTPDNQATIERQANDPWCKKCAGFHKPNEACY